LLRRALPLAIAFGTMSPGFAQAQTYDPYSILSAFNVIVTGDYSSKNDIEGGAIIGTLTGTQGTQQIFTSFLRGTDTSTTLTDTSTNTSTTYGTINIQNIASGVTQVTVAAGAPGANFVDVNNNPYSARVTLNGGTVQSTPTLNMSAFSTPLNALQVSLGALTANRTATFAPNGGNNPLTFDLGSSSSTIAVFNITTASLGTATSILFTGTAQSVVINVAGTTFNDIATFVAPSDISLSNIIWNFENATAVNFTNWEGSVLAGQATVTNNNPIEGTLYAANFIGSGEVHDYLYQPPVPPTTPNTPVPEPASMLLFGSAVAGIAGLRRRRV
jgi:choice-of-anchor A domain-containing protein